MNRDQRVDIEFPESKLRKLERCAINCFRHGDLAQAISLQDEANSIRVQIAEERKEKFLKDCDKSIRAMTSGDAWRNNGKHDMAVAYEKL